MTTETASNSLQSLFMAWVAMLFGMSALLLELVTGVFNRLLPGGLVWAGYLIFLLSSVWGMKTLLERQGSGVSLEHRFKDRGKSLKSVASKNLWKLPIEGQMYLLMAIIMLLGSLFGKTNTLMLMFALMAGPFIVNGGVTFAMTRKLMIERRLPERVMAGEVVSIEVMLINRKRFLSSSLVAVEDQIVGPRELLVGKLMFTHVPAFQMRNGRYQARFMQRGRYRLGPTRIVSRFPLGIVERGRQVESYDELLVYPRIGTLAESWKRRLADGQEVSRSTRGRAGAHHDEFHRIREYRVGDEIRSIHWKTTARKNELMVKEYRETRDRRILLVLDLARPTSPESGPTDEFSIRCELAASLAATIGWNHTQECGPEHLDLLCFGAEKSEWLGSSRSEQTLGWVDQLALIEPGEESSPREIEHEIYRHLTGDTRCVLITTRKESDYDHTATADSLDGASDQPITLHNVMILEADPQQTESFFSL